MLSLNRTSLYYKPRPSSEWDLQLNRLIDITYTKHPEFGYRRITAWLDSYYGFHVDKKTVVFCQVLFPEKSVEIPCFRQGIFPTFGGH